MDKIYLLMYEDALDDSREAWNIFYVPIEVFATREARKKRIEELEKEYPDFYHFNKRNLVVNE
jgi:hypothetical protein